VLLLQPIFFKSIIKDAPSLCINFFFIFLDDLTLLLFSAVHLVTMYILRIIVGTCSTSSVRCETQCLTLEMGSG
jgi:hypothetical protein